MAQTVACATKNKTRRTKTINLLRFAGDGDATVVVEVIREVVPVDHEALAVVVQVRDIAIAVLVHHERAKSRLDHRPLITLGAVSNLALKCRNSLRQAVINFYSIYLGALAASLRW